MLDAGSKAVIIETQQQKGRLMKQHVKFWVAIAVAVVFIVLMIMRPVPEQICTDGSVYERHGDYWIDLAIKCVPISK